MQLFGGLRRKAYLVMNSWEGRQRWGLRSGAGHKIWEEFFGVVKMERQVPGGRAGKDERMKTKMKEAKGTGDPAEHGRETAEMTD